MNFCIKHVQGSTSQKQEVLVSVVDPWTCLLQKIPVVTWDVLLYTSSGAKCTYDTLAFSWRFVIKKLLKGKIPFFFGFQRLGYDAFCVSKLCICHDKNGQCLEHFRPNCQHHFLFTVSEDHSSCCITWLYRESHRTCCNYDTWTISNEWSRQERWRYIRWTHQI